MSSLSINDTASQTGSSEPEMSELWSHHLEQLGEKLNHDGDRTGFLRMVNRNHAFNCSNYSLSSLFRFDCSTFPQAACLIKKKNYFSVASGPSTSTPSRAGSQRSRRAPWQGPACISGLYHMLIAPFDDVLAQSMLKYLSHSHMITKIYTMVSCKRKIYLWETNRFIPKVKTRAKAIKNLK